MIANEKIKKLEARIQRLEKISNFWFGKIAGQAMIKIIPAILTSLVASIIAVAGFSFFKNKDSYVDSTVLIILGIILFIVFIRWITKKIVSYRIEKLNDKLTELKVAAANSES